MLPNCNCKDGFFKDQVQCLPCLAKCLTCLEASTCKDCGKNREGKDC